jgi:hypothetical protein
VLSVTDLKTDLTLDYKTKFVSQSDEEMHAAEMKIEYQEKSLNKISPACFGAVLANVTKITVFADIPKMRYPSGCAYDFHHSRKPQQGCGLPMNFDYGSVYYMVQMSLPSRVIKQDIIKALAQVRQASKSHGHGHPGITTESNFLQQLEQASCKDIKDDVLTEPYYDDWRVGRNISETHWCPVLREDGFVCVYQDDSDAAIDQEQITGYSKYYIIVHNALAYFACDQLRVLIEANSKGWTWAQWKASAEVRRATELPTVVAKTVCDRVVASLETLNLEPSNQPKMYDDASVPVSHLVTPPSAYSARRAARSQVREQVPIKQGKLPVIVTYNIINPDSLRIDTNTISYDAGVVRSSAWSKEGTLTHISNTDDDRFVWMKNLKCENGHWATKIDKKKYDVLIPSSVDDTSLDEICTKLKRLPEFTLQRIDLISIES